FTADDRFTGGAFGRELWESDGTASGTKLVKDIRPGPYSSDIHYLTGVGGRVFFVANDGVSGDQLWSSDGSESGTALMKDIRPGPSGSYPFALSGIAGQLFFSANDGTSTSGPANYELWRSSGVAVGTSLVADINPGPGGSYPVDMTLSNGLIFLTAN